MNEWQFQKRLTSRWVRDGVEVSGELCFLIAWEVMVPSWRINDASTYWAEPSIDFVAGDARGGLVAIELKMKVPGRKPAWRVLCQVTHRAMLLRDTFSQRYLNAAHQAAMSGRHGRISGTDVGDLAEEHRRFFGKSTVVEFFPDDIKRVVAATEFGTDFNDIMYQFDDLPSPEDLELALANIGLVNGARSNREVERLVAVMSDSPLPLFPVQRIVVEP